MYLITFTLFLGGYHESIKKQCALGPCYLRDSSQDHALGVSAPCDKSQDSYLCVECCQGDGCNEKDFIPSKSSKLITMEKYHIPILMLLLFSYFNV